MGDPGESRGTACADASGVSLRAAPPSHCTGTRRTSPRPGSQSLRAASAPLGCRALARGPVGRATFRNRMRNRPYWALSPMGPTVYSQAITRMEDGCQRLLTFYPTAPETPRHRVAPARPVTPAKGDLRVREMASTEIDPLHKLDRPECLLRPFRASTSLYEQKMQRSQSAFQACPSATVEHTGRS